MFGRCFGAAALAISLSLLFQACTKPISRSFAPLAKTQSFSAADVTEGIAFAKKTDVLFVIDNSRSMDPAQDNILAAMNRLVDLISGDACFGVTTTAAYVSNVRFLGPAQPNQTDNLIRSKLTRKYCTRRDDGSYNDLNQLKADIRNHADVGTDGDGSEMALNSLMEFINRNEAPGAAFPLFRPGSERILFVVSDEENQSRQYTSLSPLLLVPGTRSYFVNPNDNTNFANANCNRSFMGYDFGLWKCADFSVAPRLNYSVFKSYLDEFFQNLDQSGVDGDPNYLISFITHKEVSTLKRIRKLGNYYSTADYSNVDDRNFSYDVFQGADEIVQLVGNGSSVNDIGQASYDAIFANAVEQTVQIHSVFSVAHNIDRSEPVYVIFQCNQTGVRTPITEFVVEANRVLVSQAFMTGLISGCPYSEVFIDYTPENLGPPSG